MISAVCVYNDEEILNQFLLKSLQNQTVDYELILVDNTQNKFKSAAQALNYGGKKAEGKYIIFVHQDVDLSSVTWLEDAEKILDSLDNLGIAGVAGKAINEKGVITNIKHHVPLELGGEIQIKDPKKVQTLDECLVIIPSPVFRKIQFDEEVCDGWHLYAVDYSLSIEELGFDVYVIPIYLYHLTATGITKEYYSILNKLLKKHKKDYRWIYTTMADWNTIYPLNLQRVWIAFKNIFLKKVKVN